MTVLKDNAKMEILVWIAWMITISPAGVAGFTRKNCSLGNNSLTTAIIKIKSKYDQNKTKL